MPLRESAKGLVILVLAVAGTCVVRQAAAAPESQLPPASPAASTNTSLIRDSAQHVARTAQLSTQRAAQPSEETRRQYDRDGDGNLGEQERQVMMQDLLKQAQQQYTQLMLRRYDVDKNGLLDTEERGRMQHDADKLGEQAQKAQGEWIKGWDSNGDGKLSPEEEKQMRAESANLQAEMIKRWDLDGDAKLSAEERNVAQWTSRADMEKPFLEMDSNGDTQVSLEEQQAYWKKVAARYDRDADGRLNDRERQQLRKQEDLQSEWWFLAWTLSGARAPSTTSPAATRLGS
jgi:hypothetical protein